MTTLVKSRNGNATRQSRTLDRPFNFTFPSLFNDFFDRFWASDETSQWVPAVNVIERPDDYRLEVAAPGMNKEDFRVEVDNGVLSISGERREERKDENENLARREFYYGSFRRAFTLPDGADPNKVSATYQNGILTVTLPKMEEAKRKPKKQVEIA